MRFFPFGCFWNRFRYCTKLAAKRAKLVQLMQKFMPRSHVGIFRNERTQSPHWILNSCFGALQSVGMYLGSFRNCMKLDAKQGQLVQLMQKFVPRFTSGFFATNTPNPHHWTLNTCFGAFLSVWVHLGPFRYCTKMRQTSAINTNVRATLSC